VGTGPPRGGGVLPDQVAKITCWEKVVTNRHPLTVIDVDTKSLTLRKIDE
jgi:hypothetical protein